MNQDNPETSEAPDIDIDNDTPIETTSEADVETLRQRVAAAEREAERYRDEHLRALAEIENLRKRMSRDVEAANKYGAERLIKEILPVKDSLDMGLAAASEGQGVDADSDGRVQALVEGVQMTIELFENTLKNLGVSIVDPQGERFDPERHQAMNTVATAEVPAGQVVAVLQRGFLLHDRLIRPALVSVSSAPSGESGSEPGEPAAS